MELKWDSAPVSDPGPFSREVFEKFSLAPSMKELWAILQSQDVKPDLKEPKTEKSFPPAELPQSNTTSPGASHNTSDCKDSPPNRTDFPNPKVPYPCYCSLNHKERMSYLYSIKNKNYRTGSQALLAKANSEITEFMKYLQDVAKVCADDYKYLPPGAARYFEEYFKHCLDHLKNYPQFYSIQEITSLTGGKFIPNIFLNFEKQLLAMGNIQVVGKQMLPENTQLAVDYESVSAATAPLKKATSLHTPISSDKNAERLSATYEPHVCLAKEAFIQLLNNTGSFTEEWELPVYVKTNPQTGGSQSKTVYIDPPLLKTQMTWRERNQLFHEESVKLVYIKSATNPVFFLASEDFSNRPDFSSEEQSSRAVVSFDSTNLDFEVDVTDLESFGESSEPKKKTKDSCKAKNPSNDIKSKIKQLLTGTDMAGLSAVNKEEIHSNHSLTISKPQEEPEQEEQKNPSKVKNSLVDESEGVLSPVFEPSSLGKDLSAEETIITDKSPAVNQTKPSTDSTDHGADSDEERLVIDDVPSTVDDQVLKPSQNTPAEGSDSNCDTSIDSCSPIRAAKATKKRAKRSRLSADCDQLGQILQMQNAMLKCTTNKNPEPAKAPIPETCSPKPKLSNHPTSLVKPSVTAYLESRERLQSDAATPVTPATPTKRKRLLREDLLVCEEDEQDFDSPDEGSLLYKLYSLQDVLLMVRSTVNIVRPRNDQGTFRAVPVHVLPKLEYQLCYGAESLTHTEACQLWTEQLLHSSTISFIGRINAHTSKVVELQELQKDWIQDTNCDFKPAGCLNTLYHILKKVMGLQEGRYLLGHKSGEAFLTIFKAADGKKPSRSIYDLHTTHHNSPVVPALATVPWVPLDPYHIMPIHTKHHRPPCLFPPHQRLRPKTHVDARAQRKPGPFQKNQGGQNKKNKKSKWKKNAKKRKKTEVEKES